MGSVAVGMMDGGGLPDTVAAELRLVSITPRGPIHDGHLSTDPHLIDNLVNLFAKPQVGPLPGA